MAQVSRPRYLQLTMSATSSSCLAGSDLLVQSKKILGFGPGGQNQQEDDVADAGWHGAGLGSHLDLVGGRPFHRCAGVLFTDLA